jgi:hypothetical protein
MEKILDFIRSFLPANFDVAKYFQFVLILAVGMLVISILGRIIFGKRSTLNYAVSSAIAIVFMYVVNVVVYSLGLKWSALLTPLPFVSIEGEYLLLFNIIGGDFRAICGHILNLVILAFVMNLIQTLLPKGKKMLSWYFWRLLSVVLAFVAMYFVNLLVNSVMPAIITQNAPMVLVILLIAALLLGALKLLVGGVLAFVNPLLALLYTFFFSNIVGKQLSKAILTTTLLTALVYLLNSLGIVSVFIGGAALIAYIPLLIIALVLWYVIGHIL